MAQYRMEVLLLLLFWILVVQFGIAAAQTQRHVSDSGSSSASDVATSSVRLLMLNGGSGMGSSTKRPLKARNTTTTTTTTSTTTTTTTTEPSGSSGSNTTTTNRTSSTISTASISTDPQDPCYTVSCVNGGTCYQGSCLCPVGYTGERCQTATVTAASTSTTTTTTKTTTTTTTTSTPLTASSTPVTTWLATSIKAMTVFKLGRQMPVSNTKANSSLSNGTRQFGKNETNEIEKDKADLIQSKQDASHNDVKPPNLVMVVNATSDPCHSMPCHNAATCRPKGELYVCLCPAGYVGDRCETAICSEDYLPVPANGLKSCVHQPETMTDISCELTCKKGYYFKDEQLTHVYDCTDGLWLPSEKQVAGCYRIDYCANVTCKNNGTCEELWRDATCHCQPGFEGDRCQLDIDECKSSPCKNGGTCVDGTNMFQCFCPTGFAGIHCETEVVEEPILKAVTPGFGPHAGGTLITVTGSHLIVPSLHIFMYLSDMSLSGDEREKILCNVLKSNSTHIVAMTPAVEFNIIRYLPIAVQFAGGAVYQSRLYYEYRPNPEVRAVEPTDTIIAGGTSVTISGKSLDSVAIPEVQVTLVAMWQTQIAHGQVVTNKVKTVFAEPCILPAFPNKTSLICHMPKMEIPDEVYPLYQKMNTSNRKQWNNKRGKLRRRSIFLYRLGYKQTKDYRNRNDCRKAFSRQKREQFLVGSDLNKTDLRYYLGLKFDGEQRYMNLSAVPGLQQYGTLTVYDGPVIHVKKTPIKYKDLGDGPLIINGSGLLEGVRVIDYNITVGSQPCVIVEINNVIIMCHPPEVKPQTDGEAEDPVIMVRIGTNIYIRYGTMQYPPSLWIIIGPVIGALVVLIAIIIAVIYICLRRNRKAQKHKTPYLYSPGEMIRLPSVKQDRRNERFSIQDRNNDSLLVFSPNTDLDELHDLELASHCDASSAVTTTDDEFDPPEEFYENKETIKKQKEHKMALDQFIGNSGHVIPRYTAEPQTTQDNKRQPMPSRLAHLKNGHSEEDIYVNDGINPHPNSSSPAADEDIYENSKIKAAASKAGKKDKRLGRRKHTKLPAVPQTSGLDQGSGVPPPVPNTPRPKLGFATQANNNRQANYKHNSLGHPFDEHSYTNSRIVRSDDDDDDIYVNSPIKSRGLRASSGRRRPARRQNGRGSTLWF